MVLPTFFILLLVLLSLFLGSLAVQFIKLERRLEDTVDVLEDELVDVFGSHSQAEKKLQNMEKEKAEKEAAAMPGGGQISLADALKLAASMPKK